MKDSFSMFRLPALLLVLCSLALPTQSQTQTQTQRSTSSSNWTWNQSDDGKKIEVKVENKVEFNEDYTDVSAIPDEGALRIHDSRGAQTFRLVVTRGANGELKREYSVDGRTQPFDDRGKQWLREVLLKAVREGGLDAKNRVRRILKRSGTRGLIEEMGYVKGDYVRRIYFEEFLQVPGLSDADLKSALRNASTTIDGDYERAQLLLQVGTVFLGKRELIPDYFEAVNRFKSAYEHHRVLSGALKRDDLSREALSALVLSAAKIDSDYEKATFLIKAASRYQADEVLRKDWLSALRTVGSDYEHHRVLSGALKAPELSNEALLSLVESAARMASDYEKASFLIEALGHYQPNARLRAAFVNTAKTINSEYERGRVQKRMDKQDF
jgi:hypothetical protein